MHPSSVKKKYATPVPRVDFDSVRYVRVAFAPPLTLSTHPGIVGERTLNYRRWVIPLADFNFLSGSIGFVLGVESRFARSSRGVGARRAKKKAI